jgi:hypothetical protein
MKPPALLGMPWTEHYETLRRHVLTGREHFGAEPFGVGLICRRGLAGWIAAWRCATQSPGAALPPPPQVSITPGCHHELTVLLAEMTVPHLSPALS